MQCISRNTSFLEGAYDPDIKGLASLSSTVDPVEGSISYEEIWIYRPPKCGLWLIYHEGIAVDSLRFPECTCKKGAEEHYD